ncbi:MAG TPA: NAD(P)-dependent oxidoreductase [Terriglobia bacterium]|nr:NAD(P)-dependent oxidoreductase [Terriglobia bacterium]
MNIGFIGLGQMGMGMARSLLKAGHALTVYNRTRSRAEQLVPEGARVASTPGEACRGDAVITMLADDRALQDVMGDLTASLGPATVHVSMSTISVAMSRRLAKLHAELGRCYIAAPVFGRPEAAAAQKLFVVAAGPRALVERCQPLFDAMGQKTFVVSEDAPAANVIKLCGNFMIASILEILGESVALARKSGVDASAYLEVMTGTLFNAPVFKTYGALIAQEKYEPAGFKAALGLKDARLVLAAADDAAVPMPVANLVHDRLLALVAQGRQDLDWSALARLAAEQAGLTKNSGSG